MRLVLVIGPLGVGKSQLIEGLSRRFPERNAVLDADYLAMTRPGGTATKRLDLVEKNIIDCSKNFREWGAKYVFCAWVMESQQRLNGFRRDARQAGFELLVIALDADQEALRVRLEGRKERPFVFSAGNKRWLEGLTKNIAALRGCLHLNTSELSRAEVLDAATLVVRDGSKYTVVDAAWRFRR